MLARECDSSRGLITRAFEKVEKRYIHIPLRRVNAQGGIPYNSGLLEEYIGNEDGLIWSGSENDHEEQKWHYGQFSQVSSAVYGGRAARLEYDAFEGGLHPTLKHCPVHSPLFPDRVGLVLPADCGNRSLAPFIGAKGRIPPFA